MNNWCNRMLPVHVLIDVGRGQILNFFSNRDSDS
jgi:hypothetical protein